MLSYLSLLLLSALVLVSFLVLYTIMFSVLLMSLCNYPCFFLMDAISFSQIFFSPQIYICL